MEIEFDVKQVFQDRLASSMGLDKYQYIMNNVRRVNISTNADFQRTFNGLYIVRRNEDWRDIYYKLFEEIITYLYKYTGNIEPSFSSKMLATIIPSKPIWDQYVVQKLNMKLGGKSKEEKLENAIVLYDNIEKWYEDYLLTSKARECIETFDQLLPDYKHISNIKKIDSILWSIR